MPERRDVHYSTGQDVIDDIQHLRAAGCEACGQWSLAQACWHLNLSTRGTLAKVAPAADTPGQIAARGVMPAVFNTGRLPSGIKGPPQLMPPTDAGDQAIDDFVESLHAFDAATELRHIHPIFGNVTQEEMRRLSLIHTAHHLSHFVPKNAR